MAGILKEPRVITDYRREPVCILPAGFYFDDERWRQIWQRFEEKGEALPHGDLRTLLPDEPALRHTDLQGAIAQRIAPLTSNNPRKGAGTSGIPIQKADTDAVPDATAQPYCVAAMASHPPAGRQSALPAAGGS